jgi:hypothetical protein
MRTITARIPDGLLKDIEEIEVEERSERAQVIRKLLDSAVKNWKLTKALKDLGGGRITMRTAASRAGLTYVEMLDRAKEEGIQIGYSMEDFQRDMAGLRGTDE